MKNEDKGSLVFRKYGLLIPSLFTLFLEILKYLGHFKYSWFWVISPIWIWVGGVFQLFLAAFLYGIQKEFRKNK